MKKMIIKTTEHLSQDLVSLKSRLSQYLMDEDETTSPQMVLYILSPGMQSFDLVINLINDTNLKPNQTIAYYYLEKTNAGEFSPHQVKSVKAIGEMVLNNGGIWFQSEEELLNYVSTTDQND